MFYCCLDSQLRCINDCKFVLNYQGGDSSWPNGASARRCLEPWDPGDPADVAGHCHEGAGQEEGGDRQQPRQGCPGPGRGHRQSSSGNSQCQDWSVVGSTGHCTERGGHGASHGKSRRWVQLNI